MRKVIRLVISDTCFFQLEPPDGEFRFDVFCEAVRQRGFFFDGSSVYVPYAHIRSMLYIDPALVDAAMSVQGMVRQ